ncbi:MAG: DUF2442 domain-containing protein [Chlorobium sp.]
MECISIVEARYVKDYQIFLTFNTGESGEVDLRDLVYKYPIAEQLRNPEAFSHFFLDSWPTLAWDCGFDVDPESLYFRATGKSLWETKAS